MITLEQPQWLLLLLPAAAAFALLARHERRLRPASLAWGRAGVRTAAAAALLLVLSVPTSQEPRDQPEEPADPEREAPEQAAQPSSAPLVYAVLPDWQEPERWRALLRRLIGASLDEQEVRPAVRLRGEGGVHERSLDEPWENGAAEILTAQSTEVSPLRYLLPDITADAPDALGGASEPRELMIASTRPPSEAQARQLTSAGWQWRWEPLPQRALTAAPVLTPLTVEPREPERDTPITVRATVWLPAEVARQSTLEDELARWRLHLDGAPLAWRPLELGDDSAAVEESEATLVPVSLAATLAPEQWPSRPSAYDAPAAAEIAPTRIARHLRLEVELRDTERDEEKGAGREAPQRDAHTLETQRGVIFREPPRWFVHTARTVDTTATRLVDLAERSGLEAETVPRLPAEPELHDYAGGVIPLGRLVEFDVDQWERLLRFVEHGGGLIVPTLRPGQEPGELPEPIPPEVAQQLATLLPVRVGPRSEAEGMPQALERFDRDGEVARASVLFMIDNSGSMALSIGRQSRSYFVREAVKHSLDNMDENDHASIAFFDSNVSGRKGPLPVTEENREKLKSFLDNFPEPSRATAIAEACRTAVQMLINDNAAVKHVVLLSDGMETVQPFLTAADWRERREDFVRNGISCSVVGVGEEYDKNTMLHVYTPENGHFHFTTTETVELYGVRIPQIFLREVRMAQERGDNLLEEGEEGEEPDVPLMALAGQLPVEINMPYRFAMESAPLPPLLQAVQQEPWPTSTSVLSWREPGTGEPSEVETSAARHPLLVSWPVGRGEVAAWGSTFGPEAAPDWHDWPAFADFLGRWWRRVSNADPGLFRVTQPRWRMMQDGTLEGAGDERLVLEAYMQRADGKAFASGDTVNVTLLAPSAGNGAQAAGERVGTAELASNGRLRVTLSPTEAADYGALRLHVELDDTERDESAPGASPQEATVLPLPPEPLAQPAVAPPRWREFEPSAEDPLAEVPGDEQIAEPSTEPPASPPAEGPRPAHQWIVALLLLAAALLTVDVFLRR